MTTAIPIIIFLLILSVVIFIHELGHFLAARRAGIFVEEFALGMGPKLIEFKGKKPSLRQPPEGEEPEVTRYTLRALPIGGFCKMRGQDEDVPDDPEAMNNKSVGARMLVIAGGSVMNFILAFLIFFILTILQGYSVQEVQGLMPDSPGYNAGLQIGDRITHINGVRVNLLEDFMFMMESSGGREIDVRVNRSGEILHFAITPMRGPQGYLIGFNRTRRAGLLHSRPEDPGIPFQRAGVLESGFIAAETILFHVRTPFRLIARFAAGQTLPEGGGVMGPIGLGGQVVEVYQEVIQFGFLSTFLTMLFIMGLLNAALGIMNLLPIPALDGARLIFLAIEGIRRKPVPPEREAVVHLVGIVAILALAVFIAYRDIGRLI